jgi:hypothetical protein
MLVRHFATAVAVGVLGLQVTSCGSSPGESSRVADAVEKVQDDLVAGRFAAVCAAMTDRAKLQVGTVGHDVRPTTCRADLRRLVTASRTLNGSSVKGLGQTLRPHVAGVRIRPDGATAVVEMGSDEKPFDVLFAKDRGKWRLNDVFGAVAQPPKDLQ